MKQKLTFIEMLEQAIRPIDEKIAVLRGGWNPRQSWFWQEVMEALRGIDQALSQRKRQSLKLLWDTDEIEHALDEAGILLSVLAGNQWIDSSARGLEEHCRLNRRGTKALATGQPHLKM